MHRRLLGTGITADASGATVGVKGTSRLEEPDW